LVGSCNQLSLVVYTGFLIPVNLKVSFFLAYLQTLLFVLLSRALQYTPDFSFQSNYFELFSLLTDLLLAFADQLIKFSAALNSILIF